jgi:C4-type Zn-finger protein
MPNTNSPGNCPNCGSTDLKYRRQSESANYSHPSVRYPFKCNKCGKEGAEVYMLEFSNYEDEDGEQIE